MKVMLEMHHAHQIRYLCFIEPTNQYNSAGNTQKPLNTEITITEEEDRNQWKSES
jgi:hypothetical protein